MQKAKTNIRRMRMVWRMQVKMEFICKMNSLEDLLIVLCLALQFFVCMKLLIHHLRVKKMS